MKLVKSGLELSYCNNILLLLNNLRKIVEYLLRIVVLNIIESNRNLLRRSSEQTYNLVFDF